jgi:hypothetical protein
MPKKLPTHPDVSRFDRNFFDGTEKFTRIGAGSCGGKASGLLFIKDILASGLDPRLLAAFEVSVPTLTVITTELFDQFMERNALYERARSGEPDDRVAHAFQRADLPVELLGDLRALVEKVHSPLAIRSSSLLEDALYEPFAGVYATKMIPNNQFDADSRFRRLVEAIKYVYASTFFSGARHYRQGTRHAGAQEKMAVIVQEVVGRRHGDRFYPDISGVARSFSYYRSGHTRPEDGVVNLALGLGKTIVDGGLAWSYSPAYPRATPPFGSPRDQMDQTQTEFWAVNMGKPPAYDPTAEAEYLLQGQLSDAEADGTLQYAASSYDPESDRIVIGLRGHGPRVLNFAPLLTLDDLPFNPLVQRLLALCQEALGAPVEVEFAVTVDPERSMARFGFLQVRPMVVSEQVVDISAEEPDRPDVLVFSDTVMGNGVLDAIRDIVYVKPETFEARHTPQIAREVSEMNARLTSGDPGYLLIGFGRWGSSDPWLGIPVEWSQINGARAIVEASLPAMNVDLSQGSHFFHNISSFRVSYFSVRHTSEHPIDWTWLAAQPGVNESAFVRHVRVENPLVIKVDGASGRGLIRRG